jgi:hypothetical protein
MRAAWGLRASTIGALRRVGLLGCSSLGSAVSPPQVAEDASNPPPSPLPMFRIVASNDLGMHCVTPTSRWFDAAAL